MLTDKEVVLAFTEGELGQPSVHSSEKLMLDQGVLYAYSNNWPLALYASRVTDKGVDKFVLVNSTRRGGDDSQLMISVISTIQDAGFKIEYREIKQLKQIIASGPNVPNTTINHLEVAVTEARAELALLRADHILVVEERDTIAADKDKLRDAIKSKIDEIDGLRKSLAEVQKNAMLLDKETGRLTKELEDLKKVKP